MSREGRVPIECWTICEERRSDALTNGYERLVSVLGCALGESAVSDFSARERLKEHIEARTTSGGGGRLLIVGHRADLRLIGQQTYQALTATQGLDVLELQFTTVSSASAQTELGEIRKRPVPYCSIRELVVSLSQARSDHFVSQDKLNDLIEAYRAEANKTVLDPLLPLAVLVDGFLVTRPTNLNEWFRPGIEAALDAGSHTIHSVATKTYWAELAKSKLPIEHIGEMLARPVAPARGFTAVLMTARDLGWGGGEPSYSDPRAEAVTMYRRACEAVKAVWDMLTSKEGTPPGDTEIQKLVEAASVGFHVLAAGHL